jgi:hypothetical protein
MPDYPLERTSNSGRQITVDQHEDHPERLVFSHEQEEVAELEPPEVGGPERTDGMVEWRLSFFNAWPETPVLGPLDDPPIDGALFYVDLMLDESDED